MRDALDIKDDRVRLVVVHRDREGATAVCRVGYTDEPGVNGTALSQLWLSKGLGGMPTL